MVEVDEGRFEEVTEIGEGAFGVVYKAFDTKIGSEIALKRVRLDEEEEGIPNTTIREISLLKGLEHPNVIRLYDVVFYQEELTLVFELMDRDLKDLMEIARRNGETGLDGKLIKRFLRQMFEGIKYIHKKGILHRDLKPQNLLINSKFELKIADFGLARPYGIPVRNYTNAVVTLWYRPPDILLGQKRYSTPVDLWSIGCIMSEMCTGEALFTGRSDESQLHEIFDKLGSPNEQNFPRVKKLEFWKPEYLGKRGSRRNVERTVQRLGKEGRNLFMNLLRMDPVTRVSARRALLHKFFMQDGGFTVGGVTV